MARSLKPKMLPLSSLSIIIAGTTFSYVLTASEGNFILSKPSSSDASSGYGLGISILVQN